MLCVCVNVYVHVFLSVCVSLAAHGHLHQFISKKAFYWKHAPPPHMFVLKSTLLLWLSSFLMPPITSPAPFTTVERFTLDSNADDNILSFHSKAYISAGNCERFGT